MKSNDALHEALFNFPNGNFLRSAQISVIQSVTKHLPALIVCPNDLFVCLTLHSTPMGAYDVRTPVSYLVFFLALGMCILFCDMLEIRNLKIVKCFS